MKKIAQETCTHDTLVLFAYTTMLDKIKGKSQHHLFNGILKVNISTAFQKFVQSLFFKH